MLPGDFIYKDYNGDNIINDLDRTAIGYPRGQNPFLSYGGTFNAGYKGIQPYCGFSRCCIAII